MIVKSPGFVQLQKQEANQNLTEFNCILHEESLCKKTSL